MWFGKSIITKIGLAMALAVPALAADVAPFHFSGTEKTQQDYWNLLMKYKMFGQTGILFKCGKIFVPDQSGWFGTATGDFILKNQNHTVGGPVLIGGKIEFDDGIDTISTGPLRADSISTSNFNGPNVINGAQCVSGPVAEKYKAAVPDSNEYFGTTCPASVPTITKSLTVPTVPSGMTTNTIPSIHLNDSEGKIVVPSGPGVYDAKIESISMENVSTLYVQMPAGGRLTRIFVTGSLNFAAHPKIRVQYYNNTSNKYETISNEDYSGNLLFYSDKDIAFPAINSDDSIQGTFISKGTISIEQHMTLAGQLLANYISINADFDGSGFLYVPFDPDTLDPTALAKGRFPENDKDIEVPIQLDSNAQVDVHFDYCFDVIGKGAGYAERADFKVTTLAKFPVCGESVGSVTIPMDSLTPSADTKVYINVVKDGKKENDETLVLRIMNLKGAVMPDSGRSGEFYLTIVDADGPEFADKVASYDIKENAKKDTVFATIPIKGVDIPAADIDKFELIVGGADSAAVIPLFNFDLVPVAVEDAATYDTAYIKISVKTTNLDYETLAKTSYKVTLRLKNDATITDSTTRTINVIDVNEKPVLNDTTLSVAENKLKGTIVGTIAANDPDTKNSAKFGVLEYSIIDTGVPFSITASSNKGTIKTTVDSLDYETTPDHKYEFDVRVINCERDDSGNKTNKCLYDTAHVVVNITDENEPPVIIDDGKTYDIDEHTPTSPTVVDAIVGKLEVKDVDGADVASKLVVSYVVNDDASSGPKFKDLFYVPDHVIADGGKMWLVIAVKDPTILDYESIKSSYSITMTVKDRGGATGSYAATVKKTVVINDVNEAPSITGVRGENDGLPAGETRAALTLYPVENLAKDASIGVVQALDPDTKHPVDFGHLEYRIIPDASNPVPFYMKGGTDSTIYVGDASKMNHEDGVVYTFDVEVNNCEKNASGQYTLRCLADTAKITVKIQNVPEDPKINCFVNDTPQQCKVSDVYENTAVGTLVHAFQITDPDKGQIASMTAVLTDRKSGGTAANYFKAVTNGDSLKILVKSGINYEALPKDTIFNVKLTITDADGKTATFNYRIDLVDVNEAPVFASKNTTISVKENTPNGTVVGKLPASDPDTLHVQKFGHLEYSIINRVENNIPFDMDSNEIVVTDVKRLDYEALQPTAKFEFKVLVANCELNSSTGKYDGACLYDTANVSLSVTDEPEKTVIIPDCEGPDCEVCVGEGCGKDDVDSLCIAFCDTTSRGDKGDSVLTVMVYENSPTGYMVLNYVVSDEDVGTGHTDKFEASMKNTNNSGLDSLFKIEMKKIDGHWRVVVSVKDKDKLDYEKIKDVHALTIYVRDPEDPAGMGDSLRRIIKVIDKNEAPVAKDATIKPNENLPKGTVIGKLEVSEPDIKHVKKFGHLEYSIIGKDSTFVFAMDSNKVVVNDPSKMDYELAVHDYTFDVLIANCELNSSSGKYDGACLYDTANVIVNIQNINEPPTIVIDGPDDPDGHDDSDSLCIAFCDTTSRGVKNKDTILTVGVRENPDDPNDSTGKKIILTPTNMILFQYHVVDEDTNHASKAKVSWFDAASTIPGVSTTGSDLFTIEYDAVKHVITVRVKDEKLLDYEALRNAKTRNDPDPEYTMGIVVTDPDGLADTLYRKIRVTDENEKPFFEVWPLVITENNKINDSLGHVEHPSDIDSMSRNPALYDNGFKMIGGDTALFWLDKDSTDLMRVMIRANVVLDCENGEYTCGQDSMYWVYLTYGDTSLQTTYTNLKVPVKLIDLNEEPEILTDTLGVDENAPKGTPLDTIKWFDIDRFDTAMTFKIAEDPTGCFAIDSKTGFVSVKKDKCAGLDYEKNSTVKIRVTVTDLVGVPDSLYDDKCKCQLISTPDGRPNTVSKIITVNIHDVNEPPSISDKTIAVPESTTVWTVVDTVRATDPDKKKEFSTLTYTAVSGDTAVFMIDPHSGAVILKDTLDYETKKSYVVYVQVDDGEFADTAKLKINVTNVLEITQVVITKYDNIDSTWNYPDTVYTNKKEGTITWRQDDEIVSKDTILKKGKNVIVISYKNPKKDKGGADTVVIMFNDEVPVVEVTANPTHVKAENVFTIVEETGSADTNIYVNKERDSVYVHVKDPANKRDTSFALEVNLEPIKVPDATYRKMNEIADSKIMLDETPSSGVTRTAVNNDTEKMSYVQLIGGDTVTVSYMVDKNGDPIKVPVVNSKGKTESVEVITVTYKTVIDDQEVEISYIADAMTGEVFAKGPNGELMVQGASSKKGSKSGKGKDSEKNSNVSEGVFSVTTVSIDGLGMPTVVSYAVDEKGNMVKNAEGDIGYSVSYSYKNIYGNIATESVFIVLDQIFPTVEILSPVTYSIVRSNFVEVKWTVNGVEQDSLTIQGLEKGPNIIVRFYRDKAGNEASDTVSVMMKDSKSVNIAVEQPVTEIDKDKVEEYYSVNPPKKGETYAVSIKNPSTGKEVETLIGGSFKTKEGSGEEPYPGMDEGHLGPTLALDIKLPVIVPKEGYGTVSGLATLDDIVVSDGMIPLEGVDADNATKISVEEYVEKYCEDGVKVPSDISQFNLYDSKLHAKIWVYTSLGNFVDYFNFTQELNDPTYTDEAGVLNLYFEQKPDKNGFVKADNGKQYATGAYVYKVEATIRSKLRCTLPSSDFNAKQYKETGDGFGPSAKRKGDVIKNSDELLKSFGYRRPKH